MAAETNDNLKNILNESEVSLIIDTYDDIFSDFDPRPYDVRALSEDFITAAKRATVDRARGGLELHFMIPAAVRKLSEEEMISRRLKDYFRKRYKLSRKNALASRRRSLLFIAIGMVIGLADALVFSASGEFNLGAIFTDSITLILTPASWYTIWTGLDMLISKPKEVADDEEFYKKMRDINVKFSAY